MTFRQMTSFPSHLRSPEVRWRAFLSRDCLLLLATALWGVKCAVYASLRPSTYTSRWLPVKWRDFWVTSGHLRSCKVISCRVSASCCELQPCGEWNVQYTWVFGLLHLIPSELPVKWRHFRVISGHLRTRGVIYCYVTASYCELQPCRKWNVQYMRVFGLQEPLPGDFPLNDATSGYSRPPEVTWRHFLARDCLLLRATAL